MDKEPIEIKITGDFVKTNDFLKVNETILALIKKAKNEGDTSMEVKLREVWNALTALNDSYTQISSNLGLTAKKQEEKMNSIKNEILSTISDFKKTFSKELYNKADIGEIPEELTSDQLKEKLKGKLSLADITDGNILIDKKTFEMAIIEIGGKLQVVEKRTAKGYGALGGGSEGTGSLFLSRLRDVDVTGLPFINGKYKLYNPGGGGGSAVWGDITGTITDQTDLVAYIASQVSASSFWSRDSINGDIYPTTLTDMVSIGSNTATHSLTLGSTATGYADYNTVDQTTNYERARGAWVSNVYTITTESGGTGVNRNLILTAGSGTARALTVRGIPTILGAVTAIGSSGTGSISSFGITGTLSASSNIQQGLSIFNSISQTGTAGYRSIFVSTFENTLGSGSKYLIDLGTNSAANGAGTHTSLFVVTNQGNTGIATSIPTSTNGGIDIASGGFGLIIGADNNASTRTNATAKLARIGGYHYTNTEEPITFMTMNAASGGNNLNIGGGSGIMNSATQIDFYTGANSTTLNGLSRMTITSAGLVGFMTQAPTHNITMSSTSNGIADYNTADQTTNYERVVHQWSGSVYSLSANAGGTGVQRTISTIVQGTVLSVNNAGISTTIGGVDISRSGAHGFLFSLGGVINSALILQNIQSIFPSVSQSGTAGYRTLWISPYEQTTGSGIKYLIDAGTNSAGGGTGTHTSKFIVDNSGNMLSAASVYHNFGTTIGTTGYGFRDNAGTMEYKNSGGSWTAFSGGGGTPGGSTTQLQYNNAGAFGGISGATTNGTSVTYTANNLIATSPRFITSIDDTNGNELLVFAPSASAVNELTFSNGATGSAPKFIASGSDTNIGIDFMMKGNATINFLGTSTKQASFTLFEQTTNGFDGIVFQAPASITTFRIQTLQDADGTVALTLPYGAKAYRNTSVQSIPNNTTTKIQLNAEDWDLSNEFDPTTNYRYTATTAGYYMITCAVKWNSATSGQYFQIEVQKNASTGPLLIGQYSGGSGTLVMSGSSMVQLGIGDYLELYAYQTSGSAKDIGNASNGTFMTIQRVY